MSYFKRNRVFATAVKDVQAMYYKAERHIDDLEEDNDKMRELIVKMARALNVGGTRCDRNCGAEFGCVAGCRCPIAKAMHELGITNYGRDD